MIRLLPILILATLGAGALPDGIPAGRPAEPTRTFTYDAATVEATRQAPMMGTVEGRAARPPSQLLVRPPASFDDRIVQSAESL